MTTNSIRLLRRLPNCSRKIAEHLQPTYVVAQLNARLQPIHRVERFGDPLAEVLQTAGAGEVTGGGSLVSREGEIEYCDIEILVSRSASEIANLLIEMLEQLGAPKGSKLHLEADKREIPFGRNEGIAVYLNGTDLPDEVYAECDSNFVLTELQRLLGGNGSVMSYWQGPRETAFYMYGPSFGPMVDLLRPFIEVYPLCAGCRIEQIA